MAIVSPAGAFAAGAAKAAALPPTTDKTVPASAFKTAPAAKASTAAKTTSTAGSSAGQAAAGQTAQQIAAGLLAPQYQQQAQTLATNQAALRGFAQSVLNTLKGMPDATAQAYTQAQNVTNALASRAADLLSGANPNAQDQQILQAINAPVSQQQQIAQQLGNTFTGGAGVLYDTAGANAGSALAAQKAAALAYANALPGIQGIAAINADRNLLAQDAASRAAIAAKEPGLVTTILGQQATQAYRDAQLALQGKKLTQQANEFNITTRNKQRDFNITTADKEALNRFNEWYKNASLTERQQGLQVQIDRLNATIAHNHATEGIAAGRLNFTVQPKFSAPNSRATGVPTDQYGNPIVSGTPQTSAVPGGGFLPAGAKYIEQRSDQGRDLMTTPGGAIVAPGAGYVVRLGSDPNGFGTSYPIVHFTSGPYAGQDVYIGHTLSALPAGAKFAAGTVLSHTGATGAEPWNGNASQPGWAEIGFAPGGTPGPFGQPTPFGAGSQQPTQTSLPPTLPGFTRDANGNVVKVSSSTKTSATLSPTQAKGLAQQVHAWHTGQTGSHLGVPVTDPNAKLGYTEALTRAYAQAPGTPAGRAKALQIVNAEYGTPQQIALQAAKDAKTGGFGLTDALRTLLAQQGRLPIQTYIPAFARVYGAKTSDINLIVSQLQQLAANNEINGG